ncbi:MAG: prepilin-type N-terminal cleavage/methylation domain-containing protein [Candidatus Tectomicrobia bacterium]|nr:prepilin-type N-terminal cleavage/methylation domain-containing protein [Candidatus Tectomicrobia bacterium]
MKNRFLASRDDGFTLIEVMIALAIFSIGLLGFITFQITATRVNATAQRITNATLIAEKTLEEIRNKRYGDITTENFPGQGYGSVPGFPAFKKDVTITDNSPIRGLKTLVITVSWKDAGGKERNVEVRTLISNS